VVAAEAERDAARAVFDSLDAVWRSAVAAATRAVLTGTGDPCRMTLCQPTPNARACPATVAPCRPTCSAAAAAARAVNTARGGIAPCRSVQVLRGHAGCGQHHTRLTQHSTTGRPAIGRSATHVGRRSFARATAPQVGHGTRSAVVSTISSSSPAASAAASTRNPSNPNNQPSPAR
jgi:hypothetical protein